MESIYAKFVVVIFKKIFTDGERNECLATFDNSIFI